MTLRRDRASGNPSKEFFVSMLTRDITLDDCILDLVDNSIDGAWEQVEAEPNILTADSALSAFRIDIRISADRFVIEDNCGGITLDDAADYAFTFGRRIDQEYDEFSVGVYGIGLKRAIFKIGRDISIRSTAPDGADGNLSFEVPINVPQWLAKQPVVVDGQIQEGADWDFDIIEAEPLDSRGVRIEVGDLISEISSRLGDPTYPRYLRAVLGRDYLIPLMRGLQIYVNDVIVDGFDFSLRTGGDFTPLRTSYLDGPVNVEIVAGMISSPPDSPDPDENNRQYQPYGWYVVCNGRVVLSADKTSITGWGEGLPMWHRQYDGFVGFIFFSAERAAELPMTTTKRSVDVSSGVYRRALARMQEPTRAWLNYTNARKTDLDAAKVNEQRTHTASLVEVAESPTVVLPSPPKPVSRARVGNVNYAMPLSRLKTLAKALGDNGMTFRDIGIRSFEYAYDELVEDE